MAKHTPLTLRDGVAVITGAAGGIGKALALALAARGMHLALADIDTAGLEATAAQARQSGVRVSTHVLNVADPAAIAALPEKVLSVHGRVTVLINNAGVALAGRFKQVSAADFDWLMSVNFQGTVNMTRAFLPVLSRAPVAQLVNISSLFGIIAARGQTAYCASKFAVRGFSEALRHELEDEGSTVGVTLVHPGGVRTGIAAHARLPAGGLPDELLREMRGADQLLTLPPEAAAGCIVRALVQRAPRVLVGRDAKQGAWLQRLFPVSYWSIVARGFERKLQRAERAAG